MKEKAIRWPQHKMGKSCGYEEYEDGRIEIAQSHSLMDQAMQEEEGLNAMIAALNTHLATQYKRTAALRRAFWKGVEEDYGLDFDKFDYSYNPMSRQISKIPKPKEEKK